MKEQFNDIKEVLVDFDGTLVDSTGYWTEAYRQLCYMHNALPRNDMIERFEKLSFSCWQEKISDQLSISISDAQNKLLSCAKHIYSKCEPKKAVISLISSLPSECNITIISREPCELVEHWLNSYGLMRISGVVNAGDERKSEFFYSGKGLLLIDDNINCCTAAKKAGATVIGVNDHHTDSQKKQMRKICDMYIEDQEV